MDGVHDFFMNAGRTAGTVVGLFVTNVILCDGALVDSKEDIDIGCCSPVFNALLVDGNDDRWRIQSKQLFGVRK